MRNILSAVMWGGLLSAIIFAFQGSFMFALGCLTAGFLAGTIGGIIYKNRP